jgi:hypothetical protein
MVILAAAALTMVALPARAQGDKVRCPRGGGCVWDGPDYRGRMAQIPSTGCIDSVIRSAVNTSDRTLEFFTGAGCYGTRAGTLKPGQDTPEINAGSATGDCTVGPADPCNDDPAPEPPSLIDNGLAG